MKTFQCMNFAAFVFLVSAVTLPNTSSAQSAPTNDTMALLAAGNTLRISNDSGVLYDVMFSPSGRYTTSAGSSGGWRFEDGQLCTTRDADGASTCAQLPAGKTLNNPWETMDWTGAPITAEIIPPQAP